MNTTLILFDDRGVFNQFNGDEYHKNIHDYPIHFELGQNLWIQHTLVAIKCHYDCLRYL